MFFCCCSLFNSCWLDDQKAYAYEALDVAKKLLLTYQAVLIQSQAVIGNTELLYAIFAQILDFGHFGRIILIHYRIINESGQDFS